VDKVMIGDDVELRCIFLVEGRTTYRIRLQVGNRKETWSRSEMFEPGTYYFPFYWKEPGPEGTYPLKVALFHEERELDYKEFTYTVGKGGVPPPPDGDTTWMPAMLTVSLIAVLAVGGYILYDQVLK